MATSATDTKEVLDRLSVDSDADVSGIADRVRNSGVAVIRHYLTTTEITELDAEFEQVLRGSIGAGIQDYSPETGRGALIRLEEVQRSLLPAISRTFLANEFRVVADRFFGGPCRLNEVVMAMQDVVGTRHRAQDLHFDVEPTLKFFLYLNDVTEENGAFTCVPGSQTVAAGRRAEHGRQISYANRHLTRISKPDREPIPIEGAAGTLIVFSTEILHRAAIVRHGERRILRGHSSPRPGTRRRLWSGIRRLLQK